MICLSQPALLSAVWYTLICAGPVCWYHGLAITPSAGQYLLYLLSGDLLSPISTLPSPAPAPAILTPISRASPVPAIALADMMPRGCNHHNVGGNIERKMTNVHFNYYCWNLCFNSWLYAEYFKSLSSSVHRHSCHNVRTHPGSVHIWHSIDRSDSDTSHHYFIFWVDIYKAWIILLVLSINSFVRTKENIDLVLSVTFLYLLNVEQRLVDIR